MNFLRRVWSAESILRITLGLMYLYSGIDIIRYPTAWFWAVRALPTQILDIINKIGMKEFLIGQGVVELLIAAALLIWFVPKKWVRLAALLSSVEMILILLMVGIDAVTFRDIGLIGSGFAIYQLSKRNY